ncbi:Satratoxin biosynthesis SC1 cluster protein 4 [Colletotrichum orbiculare MAFF 240422]|uniref:Satratoxin biosynthesis SC1 cluster protein 4 n=1 Tax=Colletotrichum orbiculare (strain 104-T / ATCC 96160 / CBS 514.97 / LARS 414 / MAFF 240422) TaxID=1213857 RepID=N4VKE2_COLOR|nr:Satratoxin biosynthesis SC1 cluster protein 4 [Colletotrichum orbiculare MAFF 240422]
MASATAAAAAAAAAPPPDTSGDTDVAIIIINVVLAVIATVTCGGRFWARKLTGMNWGLDDWLALASLVVNHAFCAITIQATIYGGLGRSIVVVMAEDPLQVVTFLKCVVAAEFCYGFSSPLIKLSLLAFYWRVFPTQFMMRGIWMLSAACVAWGLAIFITNCLQCRPLKYTWEQTTNPGSGTCIDLILYFVGNSIANSLIDALTLVLPIRETLKLQVSSHKKVGICCVFGLGSIVVVASLVRFGSLASLYSIGVTDMTLQYALMWTATVVEIYVAIIGACAVTLVPVYRKVRYGTPWSTRDQKSNQASNPGAFQGTGGSRSGLHNFKRSANHERLATGNDSEEYLHGAGINYAVSGTSGKHDARGNEVPLDTIVVQRDVTWEEERKVKPHDEV